MSDIFNNSIWPNGVKVVNGHGRFYPLGTNKVKVPTTGWPKGNKFVSPFVYDKDDNLVGFVDTKAMTSAGNAIYLPYELIEADFPNITQGKLQIHAPKATVKKASWKGSNERFDIPEAQFKYKGCKNVDDVTNVQYEYLADIANGTWSEPLWDLTDGRDMFYECSALTTFSSDLPSLTEGYQMFFGCSNLNSFTSDLSSLTNGSAMFCNSGLKSFSSDLSSLTNCNEMFKYCENLESFTSDLSNLTDGGHMFHNCINLIAPNINLSSLTNGGAMFYGCYNFTAFSSDLSSLTDGNYMFYYCNKLTSFSSDMTNLQTGYHMFSECSQLESFSSDLSSLTDGLYMFYDCNKLTTFNSDLPSLTDGTNMFRNCYNLIANNANLSNLTKGERMFQSCKNLTSFSSDLSSLTNGYGMFLDCYNLTSFSSDLSSLTTALYMFYNCKLDTASIQNIADTINTSIGTIYISIGNTTPNEQETTAFNTIASKGWTVYVNGSLYTPTSPAAITTLDENGEETTTPIPFWAKPVPATEETASYVDANGNYYNILGGQFIYGDSLETYGMFVSEEDAAANMRLTKFEKPQTEIEKQ